MSGQFMIPEGVPEGPQRCWSCDWTIPEGREWSYKGNVYHEQCLRAVKRQEDKRDRSQMEMWSKESRTGPTWWEGKLLGSWPFLVHEDTHEILMHSNPEFDHTDIFQEAKGYRPWDEAQAEFDQYWQGDLGYEIDPKTRSVTDLNVNEWAFGEVAPQVKEKAQAILEDFIAKSDWTAFDRTSKTADIHQFFTDATKGLYAPSQELLPEHSPQHPEHQDFWNTYRQYGGGFDQHIHTSIPQFAANQANKGWALVNAFPGAKVLDIAGSEGSWVKALAANGLEAHNLDPNFGMVEHFESSQVPGAKHIPMAFGEQGFEDEAGNWYAPHAPSPEYDVVHESMGFQFIGPERDEQVAHAKRYLKPGGLLIADEKVRPGQSPYDQAMWDYHEAQKDAWKGQYFSPEELAAKNEQVGFQPEARHKKISKLAGFYIWSADIHQLAENMRRKLLERPDVQALADQKWRADPGVNTLSIVEFLLNNIPDQGYKLMPWAVREIKRGRIERYMHAADIIEQATRWMEWAREHNKSTPDFMSKQFGFPEMEAWVYEMNATNIESDQWQDSTPVYTWEDGWHMDRVGADDLALEGELMGHCVGGYCHQVRSGDSTIYSLRDPKGQPHVTIEVSGDPPIDKGFGETDWQVRGVDVVQVQGKQDTRPIPEYQERVDEWFGHLNSDLGWEVAVQPGEPDTDYEPHPEGYFEIGDVNDLLQYHQIMNDGYEREANFGEDEEGRYDVEDNTYYYQMPRQLVVDDQRLVAIGIDTLGKILRSPGTYDEGDLTAIAQGMWMAHQHESMQNYRPGVDVNQQWQVILQRIEEWYHKTVEPEEQWSDQALFDPNVFNQARQDPAAEAFIDLLHRLAGAPTEWVETVQRPNAHGEMFNVDNRHHLVFPGTGTWPQTEFANYFNTHNLNTMRFPGTFAKTAGMMDMMVSQEDLESILQRHFRHVVQYWSSGNFKGYAASDNPDTINNFLRHYKVGQHEFEAEPTPRWVGQQQPGSTFAKIRPMASVADLVATTLTQGGGTFQQDLSPATFTHGYLVSRKGYEAVVPVDQFNAKEVEEWVTDLPLQQGDLIGTWVDGGQVYLDVSEHFTDLNEAVQFAIDNEQKAFYDAGTDTVIDTAAFMTV